MKIDDGLNLSQNEESKFDILEEEKQLNRINTFEDEIIDPMKMMDFNIGNISMIPKN